MKANRLTPSDQVKVTVTDPEGKDVYQFTGSGFRNVEQAIAEAYSAYSGVETHRPAHFDESIEKAPSFFHYYHNPDAGDNVVEAFVFTVTDLTTGTSARYRVNAGGHARLIV